MYPTFFEFYGQHLPAYFAMLMVGFGLAIYLGQRQARRSGLDHDTMIDLGLFALIWGVIGARLLHVVADGYFWDYVHRCTDPALVEWSITEAQCAKAEGIWRADRAICQPVGRDCLAWAKFWNGGLAYYGGLLAAGAYGVYFLKKERFPIGKGVDLVGMTIPLGLFFGRLGCFFGGCCFGAPLPAAHWLAVRFPELSAASESQWRAGLLPSPMEPSLPVHPTQLYESAGCLAIAAVCMLWVRPRKRFDGQVMLVFLALYAALRFGLETIRADDRGGLGDLTTSQLIGLAILGMVGVLWVRQRRSIGS